MHKMNLFQNTVCENFRELKYVLWDKETESKYHTTKDREQEKNNKHLFPLLRSIVPEADRTEWGSLTFEEVVLTYLVGVSSAPWRLRGDFHIPRRQSPGFWSYLQHSGRRWRQRLLRWLFSSLIRFLLSFWFLGSRRQTTGSCPRWHRPLGGARFCQKSGDLTGCLNPGVNKA